MIVLLGDSHFARMDIDALNLAVSGSNVRALAGQISKIPQGDAYDDYISIGTNDSGPVAHVALPEFKELLNQALASLRAHNVFVLGIPGLVEESPAGEIFSKEVLNQYRNAAKQCASESGATYIDGSRIIEDLGNSAFVEDGVHLSEQGYSELIVALLKSG